MQPPGCLLSKNWTVVLGEAQNPTPLCTAGGCDPQGSVWETARRGLRTFPTRLQPEQAILPPAPPETSRRASLVPARVHSSMVTTAKKGRAQRPSADDAHTEEDVLTHCERGCPLRS